MIRTSAYERSDTKKAFYRKFGFIFSCPPRRRNKRANTRAPAYWHARARAKYTTQGGRARKVGFRQQAFIPQLVPLAPIKPLAACSFQQP